MSTNEDAPRPVSDADWPRDPANGRLLCAPAHPMPKKALGQWAHTNVEPNGECSDGCCDYYVCRDCGLRYCVEVAQ